MHTPTSLPKRPTGPLSPTLLQATLKAKPLTPAEPVQVPQLTPEMILWTPNPGSQVAFLACTCTFCLFGGRVGGGKTDCLLQDFTGQIDNPAYNGLFIRKSYPELLQVIRRSYRLFQHLGGSYHKTEKVWTFPSGATLRFGYVRNYEDALRYASDEYQWIAIDECTHIPEDAFELLTTRLRAPAGSDLTCYVRLSANPNGRHMLWVRARFIDGKEPFVTYTDSETRSTSCFIPAGLSPQLADTGYAERLKGLGEAERKALLEGDWYAYEGSVFTLKAGVHRWKWGQINKAYGLKPENRTIPAEWTRFRAMDWGFAKPFAIYWVAVAPDNRAFVYREWYGVAKDGNGKLLPNVGARLEPRKVAEKVALIEKDAKERNVVGIADPACWAQGQGDHGGGPSVTEVFQAAGVFWTKAKNDRISGKMALHERLYYETNALGQLMEAPGLIFVEGECPHAVRTIPALEYDQHRPEDVDTDGEDHAYDSLRYFCMSRPWAARTTKKRDGWASRQAPEGRDWRLT